MTLYNFRLAILLFLSSISCRSLCAQPVPDSSRGFTLFFEKVYLHLDRNFYGSGDDIWFKAYLVNAQNNHPIHTSYNLYVELISPDATILSRKVIRLDGAVGSGDFKLEDSISSGVYRIRAYTNWMRNFGNRLIFEKEIHVSGFLTRNGSSASNWVNTENKKPKAPEHVVRFFPEGGSMVEDVPTVITWKAEDKKGKGVQARGFITENNGDTIAHINTVHAGIGSFDFMPRKGARYQAWIQFDDGRTSQTDLPQALTTGYVMNIAVRDSSNFAVIIRSHEAIRKDNGSATLNIVARHAGKTYLKKQVVINNGNAFLLIPAGELPAGIAYITLYDEKMRPYCERLVYVEKQGRLHVTVTPGQQQYGSKEKAVLQISVTDEQNRPVKAALSLSAVEERLDKTISRDIQSYLMLESDLWGRVENASTYFDKNNKDRMQQLDLLLRAQGWRTFLWRHLADTTLRISYLPEAGITISGKVNKPFSKKPGAGMNITLFAPEARGDKIYITKTDASGRFYLDGLPLYGMQAIKLNVGELTGKKIGAITMDSVNSNPLPIAKNQFYSVDTFAMKAFATEAGKRWSIFKDSLYSRVLPEVTVAAQTDKLLLEDGTMAVSFGYPVYNFNISPKDYEFRLRDFLVQKIPGARYDDDLEGILFISNGRLTRPIIIVGNWQDRFDRLDYYHLSMQQIENVQVRHMVGSSEGSGIRDYFLINLKIKPGNVDQQLSKIITSVPGYYESRIFYAPDYSGSDLSQPDERITIHWSPLVNTGPDGKATVSFYNAEPKGRIRINVQGLTHDGVPFVINTFYEVK